MKQVKLIALALGAMFITSCNNDDEGGSTTTPINVPETYTFDRDGASTVSFGGQNTRILMANEILSTFTDFENMSETQLLSMYNHVAGSNDFSSPELNESGKNIRSKVAASSDYFSTNSALSEQIKSEFESLIVDQAQVVKPNYLSPASPGVAGQVVVGERTRYVNAKGVENNQMFAKSLIGALIADQTLNNYLSTNVLDAGSNIANNNDNITEDGKNYTTMEHKWDEAYGYIYGGEVTNQADPNNAESAHNKFLHNYIRKVDTNPNFSGISDDIFKAFKKGRAAIVSKDYDIRNSQIDIIKEKIAVVIAVRAIHYLESGRNKVIAGNRPDAFHDLSEGLGFLYSLQFTQNPATGQPYLSRDEVTSLLNPILADNGLWSVDETTLHAASQAIANKFNFTVEEAL